MNGKAFFMAVMLSGISAAGFLYADTVIQSRHNLSVSGPGTVRASSESGVCVFCHTPHNARAEAPLWNRYSSGAVYVPYSSSTVSAVAGQPTGASKLCLSCHDGTVALGMVQSRPAEILLQTGSTLPPGRTNLSTDLADDHPVSVTYDHTLVLLNGELNDPVGLTGAVQLDSSNQLQCTSCHDPHDDRYGNFLVTPNTNSALCITCHAPDNWPSSIHSTSARTWNGTLPDPWPNTGESTVSANGCAGCHSPHEAETPERLLNLTPVEDVCLACHNGNVAGLNIESEFGKSSVHPIVATEVHDAAEDLIDPPRHVQCVDCHNPHQAAEGGASLPLASAALKGVRGVNSSGMPVSEVSFEYELCFRCHADSVDRGNPVINRQYVETNVRTEFAVTSLSNHAVLGPGRNPDVPSLISPYTTSSVLSCSDCHNNNAGPSNGGTGPDGPHGSIYTPLLERNLNFSDGSMVNQTNQALCFKCHSRTSLFNDESFSEHKKHLRERITCSSCHDPHGVRDTEHLINFNLQYVTSSSNGRLEFVDDGTFSGSCSLTCHGEDHDPYTY